jgi:bifunctional pyridoxal-dependent enzyme with beta-cystathionase and maltose regulon repressor activities
VRMRPSESGILSWLDVSQLGTSEEVAAYLLQEANVLVNAGSAYGEQGKGFLRIVTGVFADDTRAEAAFNRIKTALTKLAEQKSILDPIPLLRFAGYSS